MIICLRINTSSCNALKNKVIRLFCLFAVFTALAAEGAVTLLENRGDSGAAANDASFNPSMSYDGTYTVFESFATNMQGSAPGAFLYNVDNRSMSFLGSISNVTLCGDGQTITFADEWSGDVRLGQFPVAGGSTNFAIIGLIPDVLDSPSCNSNATRVTCAAKPFLGLADHLYLRDVTLGTNLLVTKPLSGDWMVVNSDKPAVDAAGDRVVFRSVSTNLVAGINPAGNQQIFLWTRTNQTVSLISHTTGGNPVGSDCGPPAISGNGRWVAFSTADPNVMAGDTNDYWDTFLYDTQNDQFYRASTPTGGGWAFGPGTGSAAASNAPFINYDGTYVLFSTEASNLLEGDTNGCPDLCRYARQSGELKLISVNSRGQQADAPTLYGVMDSSAQYVAMATEAGNMADFDYNGLHDIYFQNTDAVYVDPVAQGAAQLASSSASYRCVGGGGGSAAMSVHSVLRNLTLQHRLYYRRSAGPPIDITLYYNSGSEEGGQFGKKWSLGCANYISSATNKAVLHLGNGKTIDFNTPSVHPEFFEYEAPPGVKDRLGYSPYPEHTIYDYLEVNKQHLYTFNKDEASTNGLRHNVYLVSDSQTNQVNYWWNSMQPNGIGAIQEGIGGRLILFTNDDDGLCTKIEFPDRTTNYTRWVSFTYQNGCLKTITDMAGNVTTMTYDGDGFMLSRSSGARWMNFNYEGQGKGAAKLLSSVTDNNGTITYSGGGSIQSAGGRSLSMKSNDRGQTTEVKSASGATTSITYERYQVSAVTDPGNHTANLSYDGDLNLTGFQDARGNSGSATYQTLSTPHIMPGTNYHYKPQTVTYRDGGQINMTHTDDGKPKTLVTPSTNSFTLNYDSFGFLTSIEEQGSPIYTYTYDSDGNPLTIKDAQDNTTSFELDDFWRCIRITDPRGNTKKIDYDGLDRPTKITYETAAGAPYLTFNYDVFDMLSIVDERGKTTSVTRDPHGNVRTRTLPSGNASSFSYDGDDNTTVVTDPKGRVTQMFYDSDAHMTDLVDALGNTASRTYNAAGNITAITDQRGNITSFTYDENDNMTGIENPLGETITYQYDAESRLLGKINARGQSVSNTVDTAGRLVRHQAYDLTDVTQTYDAHGNRLTRTDATGTTTYTYDSLNRLNTITYPDSKVVDYDYDSIGNITKITYPAGMVVNYTYDDYCRTPIPNLYMGKVVSQVGLPQEKKNQVVSMNWSGGTKTLSCTMDSAANVLTETRNSTMVTEYTYDDNARRTRIYHRSGGTTLADVVLVYDAADNIRTRTVAGPSEPALTSAIIRAEYNAFNSITEWDGAVVSNDEDGNLVQVASSFTAQYDVENRLTRYEGLGVTNTFTYSGDGYIATATVNGLTHKFYYSPYGRLLFEADGAGTITRYFLYRGGILVAAGTPASGFNHYYGDINGNVLVVTDDGGSVLEENCYTPYAWAGKTGSLTNQPFRFSGALGAYDLGNDMVLMKRRIYNMRFGRFMQPDPAGYSQGAHLFLYGNGNPLKYVDPEGLWDMSKVAEALWGTTKAASGKPTGFVDTFQAASKERNRRDTEFNNAGLEGKIGILSSRSSQEDMAQSMHNGMQVLKRGFNGSKSAALEVAEHAADQGGVAGQIISAGVKVLDWSSDLDVDPLIIGGRQSDGGRQCVEGRTPDSGEMSQSFLDNGPIDFGPIDWSLVGPEYDGSE